MMARAAKGSSIIGKVGIPRGSRAALYSSIAPLSPLKVTRIGLCGYFLASSTMKPGSGTPVSGVSIITGTTAFTAGSWRTISIPSR